MDLHSERASFIHIGLEWNEEKINFFGIWESHEKLINDLVLTDCGLSEIKGNKFVEHLNKEIQITNNKIYMKYNKETFNKLKNIIPDSQIHIAVGTLNGFK